MPSSDARARRDKQRVEIMAAAEAGESARKAWNDREIERLNALVREAPRPGSYEHELALTRRNPEAMSADRKALWREIRKDEKVKARAKVLSLAEQLRAARSRRQRALANAKALCRIAARERARVMQAELRAATAAEREAARTTCSVETSGARSIASDIERARGELGAEKQFQADMRRIEAANRARKPPRATSRERRQESDDEVRQNIPEDLAPMFERVKRSIKGSARISRTEAFLQYAEEHPSEVLDAIDDKTDALIRELEAQQRRGRRNPATPWTMLGKLTRIAWKGGSRRYAIDKAPALVYDARGRLSVVYAGEPAFPATDDERAEYERTHWGQAGRGEVQSGVVVTDPVRELGAGTSITYTTAKGSRELVDWEHKWGDGARGSWTAPRVVEHVCRDKLCHSKGALALRGGSYQVNERGIVG
jgi:uncharacterized FlaG/YvyC family protein